jgi:four helix bundle protein
MRNIDNYEVMNQAHDLVMKVYRSTISFPKSESFGLKSRLRRAASSIPLTAAEGAGRGSDRDFSRFVRISLGSANELEYGLRLSRDLGYLTPDVYESIKVQVENVRRMLSGPVRALINARR